MDMGGLDNQLANQMIENCIGKVSLPLGLALNFRINGRDKKIPMSIEEPSVVAAASNAAKIIRDHASGFTAWHTDSIMVGQIQLLDIRNIDRVHQSIDSSMLELMGKFEVMNREGSILLCEYGEEGRRDQGDTVSDCRRHGRCG